MALNCMYFRYLVVNSLLRYLTDYLMTFKCQKFTINNSNVLRIPGVPYCIHRLLHSFTIKFGLPLPDFDRWRLNGKRSII